jgi:hypothetical protein
MMGAIIGLIVLLVLSIVFLVGKGTKEPQSKGSGGDRPTYDNSPTKPEDIL